MDTNRIISTFVDLVKIYSPSLMEDFVFEYLFRKFRELGIVSEIQVNGKVKNMIAFIEGNDNTKDAIFFCAHADTVEPAKDISPIIDEDSGIIKSDGRTILSADNKAGITAMLELAYHLREESHSKYGDIYLIITSAEEIGLVGAKHLDISNIKARYGYCLDSHGDIGVAIIRGATHYRFKVECIGKSSHAGIDPEKGINAIKIASYIIDRINTGLLDKDTVLNIGEIHGGKATNIVPDSVVFEGEVRSFSKDRIDEELNKISIACVESKSKFGGDFRFTYEKLYDGYSISEDSVSVKRFIQTCYKIGIKPKLVDTRGGSDANIFNSKGLETLNISCGMRNPHSCEEFIYIKDLIDISKLVISLAVS
ncbi:MAG: M20/M25/M40 family metallo-hydrolase [Brevinematales bacterium]|nr:M20/M25/M40 family metallo-hydrolase [Brevinematales bacterium]